MTREIIRKYYEIKEGDWVWLINADDIFPLGDPMPLGQVYKIDYKENEYKVNQYCMDGTEGMGDWSNADNWISIKEFTDDFTISTITPKVMKYLRIKYKHYLLSKELLNNSDVHLTNHLSRER